MFFKTYESQEIRYASKYLRNHEGLIVELGSSIGVVSSFIAKSSPLAQVLTFEADKRFIPVVENNYKINQISNANCFNEIIGADGFDFEIGDDNTMGKIVKSDTPNVTCKLFSELMKTYKINDYILISDIEGAEYFVLNDDPLIFENCSILKIVL